MKKLTASIVAIVAVATSAPAFAGYVDVITINRFMNTFLETQAVTHTVPSGPYTGASLTIALADDESDGGEFGLFDFVIPLVGNQSHTFSLGALGLASINFLNSYSYTLTRASGDFWFQSSTLALDTATSVPEPGTLVLLGSGLLGLTLLRRRRRAA